MSVELGMGGDLLSVVYSQHWPANLPRQRGVIQQTNNRFKASESRSYVRHDDIQRNVLPATKFHHCRRECWTETENGQQQQQKQGQGDGVKRESYGRTLDELTKAEFRRLKQQIRDVGASLGYKFRGAGYKSYVHRDETNPILYRSQLAESLKAFRPQSRPPLEPETKLTGVTPCRLVVGTKPMCSRPQTAPAACHTCSRTDRVHTARPAHEIDKSSTYDTLNSDLIYNLANKDQIDSGYGDRFSWDELESSDDENIPEPEVDTNIEIPKCPALRPDPLENTFTSDGERDFLKYDFDATKVEIPQYEFKYCGPEGFEKVDFEDFASNRKDWRQLTKQRPKDPELEIMIDKFVELQRLVSKTEDWEMKKRDKCRQLTRQKQYCSNLRAQGRRVVSLNKKDRKCCKNCLQLACAGDCPLKKTSLRYCLHCRQEYCSGYCVHLSYNSYSRMTASESGSDSEAVKSVALKPRPKSCQSCRRQDTNAKVINTNQILQGRPKSSLATFNRGQASVETNELLQDNHECHRVIEDEFKRLNIIPNSRPNTANRVKPRGRNALLPGKSYYSQRQNSITVSKAERVKSAPPRLGSGSRVQRTRSARCRKLLQDKNNQPTTALAP